MKRNVWHFNEIKVNADNFVSSQSYWQQLFVYISLKTLSN